MALLSGSPCYQPWRSLTGRWRDYTNTWRSFSSPIAISSADMLASELVAAYGLGEVAVSVEAAVGGLSGGWLAPLGSEPKTATLAAASAGGVEAAAASTAQVSASAHCTANVSSGASAVRDSVLVVDGGAGGLLRTVSLPSARLSTGRLTWRS